MAESEPYEGQQWEHLPVHVRKLSETELADLGGQGWELVAVDDSTAWFKRPRRGEEAGALRRLN